MKSHIDAIGMVQHVGERHYNAVIILNLSYIRYGAKQKTVMVISHLLLCRSP